MTPENLLSTLNARLDQQSTLERGTPWNPSPGDTLYGTFVVRRVVRTKIGQVDVADVRDADGNLVSAVNYFCRWATTISASSSRV